ncbi:MAG: methionyl aminopeptidase [Planctomycetota bacterium]
MARSNLGRNDPCWCGSGQKYKKCHFSADDQSSEGGTRAMDKKPFDSQFPSRARNPWRNSLILNADEREEMRRAGRFNAELLDVLRPHVGEGISTAELDRLAHEYTLDHGHVPACLGYKGYPKSICTSINQVVCHGIPSEQVLRSGDIVNVDVTTIVDGWHGDQSETFLIGEVTDEARNLTQVTFDSLMLGIDALRANESANEIGRAIEGCARSHGFAVVREYQGHGLGRKFHQEPTILHFATAEQESVILVPGMCFTVEPMINVGTWKTLLDPADSWTVRTADGCLSAQFEHTILMTEDGPEILTLTQNGPKPGHRF